MKCIMIVLALCLTAFGQAQQVENRTVVEFLGLSTSDNFTIIHLRNAPTLPLLGITITRGSSSEEDLAFQPTQKILPGHTFDFRTATSDRPIVISAVLFEDGSGSGNKRLVDTMAARLAGAEEASRFVLRALMEEPSKDSLLEIVSLKEPRQFSFEGWTNHAYIAGFLGIRQRAVKEIKKLGERRALAVESPGDDLRTYFEDVLKVRQTR